MERKTWDKIISDSGEEVYEWRICKWTGEEFPIFEKEKDILEKIGGDFPIPLPNLSPASRQRVLLMWRNERNFYKRKCDATGRDIMSIFPQGYDSPVYHFKEYDSDRWNPIEYGIRFDENRSLLGQIQDFYKKVPKRNLNLTGETMENCDYCNYGFHAKDCYMSQVPLMSEQCYYSNSPFQSKYNFDCYLNEKCEISYESSYCVNGYKVFYSEYVENSSECYFCFDVQVSKKCIGCVGISGKEYYIFNKKVTPRTYEGTLEDIFSSYEKLEAFKKQYYTFRKQFPKRAVRNKGGENVSGNIIRYSKDVLSSHGVMDGENILHSYIVGLASNHILSSTHGGSNSSHVYQSVGFSESNTSAFASFGSGNNCFYVHDCRYCENCLFCVGLMNKKHCIFNTQYSEKEYKEIFEIIVKNGEQEGFWGDFLSPYIPLFPYNDTTANEFYPVEKIVYFGKNKEIIKAQKGDENGKGIVYVFESSSDISPAILDLGGEEKINITWKKSKTGKSSAYRNNCLSPENLPETFELDEDLENILISCEVSGEIFRIISQELEFYKKYNIPLPRKHPETRYKERFKKTPKNNLYLRECSKCKKEILTVWQQKDIVCENCFLKNI